MKMGMNLRSVKSKDMCERHPGQENGFLFKNDFVFRWYKTRATVPSIVKSF